MLINPLNFNKGAHMSFKTELLKKIKIDRLADIVSQSIGDFESGRKLDKRAMRQLLEMGSWQPKTSRDLELYVTGDGVAKELVLVLDNGLGIYRTTIEDVTLRKSPTVKEMISIRNAIKILNDSDVLESKKERSVETVQNRCVEALDLSHDRGDLTEITNDGKTALENRDSDGVLECLSLFAELLGLKQAPKPFKVLGHDILGKLNKKASGETLLDTIVFYHPDANTLRLLDKTISSKNKDALSGISRVAVGEEDATIDGAGVLDFLENMAAKTI
jgi:hypothetical protein